MNIILDRIRSCKWSDPFTQDDLTPNCRCRHQNAKNEIDASSNGKLVDCWCLGFIEMCPYYEQIEKS
ncbi:MAG: hypothetical protein WC919_00730 [Candidatus Paceibacterota bacterium]